MEKVRNETQFIVPLFSLLCTFLFSTQNIEHNNILAFELSNYNLQVSSQTEIIFMGYYAFIKERINSIIQEKIMLQIYQG